MSEADRLKHAYGKINKEYGFVLATCPPEKDGPIYMVNLMKYHEVAQYDSADTEAAPISGREADDKYNPASVLNKIGADMVFIGDVTGNYMGSEDWDRIAVVRYATRKSFIEMQSRKDFGEKHVHKNAGMQRTVIVCCRSISRASHRCHDRSPNTTTRCSLCRTSRSSELRCRRHHRQRRPHVGHRAVHSGEISR